MCKQIRNMQATVPEESPGYMSDEKQSIQDSLAIINFHPDGTILSANDLFLKMMGYAEEEIIGKHHSIFLKPEFVTSNEYRQFWNLLNLGIPQTKEFLRVNKGGDEVWVQGCYVPIRSPSGAVDRVVKVAMDVTAQKQDEVYCESVLSAIDRSLAMMELNLDGTIVTANRNFLRIFDYQLSELSGEHHRILVSASEHHSEEYQEFWSALRRGEFQVSQFRRIAKSGRERWIQASYNPIYDANGKVVRVVKYATDISHLKETEDALREAQLMAQNANVAKSEFLANMSHEIRTPMTAILGFTDMLSQGLQSGEPTSELLTFVETIRKNGEQLLCVINDILDVSKIEAGKMLVESIATSPIKIVSDTIELMNVRAKSKGLSLEAVYETDMPSAVRTDPVRLRQILLNLVGNAIKFTERGKIAIRVSAEALSQTLRFDVADTGIGMTPEQSKGLFTAFVQADSSITRRYGGSGLGLQICKRLAELLGGDIELKSEIGKGSTFSFSIATGDLQDVPFLAKNEIQNFQDMSRKNIPKPVTPSSELIGEQLSGKTILVADDSVDNQRLIAFVLRKAGAKVTVVGNGRQAMELLTVDGGFDSELAVPPPVDLFITDMQMPVLDGYSTVSMLRKKGGTIPVIALTANAMTDENSKCTLAGCDDYATKPIDRKMLIKKCVEWINVRANCKSSFGC